MAESKNNILQFGPFQSLVDEGFWHRLSSLKLNKFRIDDSPVAITGFYAPCSHSQVSNHVTLLSESLPSEQNEESSVCSSSNRNRCSVPGTLYNSNNMEDFSRLDRQLLLKEEAKKIWDDIRSGKAVEDTALLSRFLLISYADLKKWRFLYWFAFPALLLDPPATVVELKPASQWFSAEEAVSVEAACNEWRSSNLTAHIPFFVVSVAPNAHATILTLKDWEASQDGTHKVLFGFYDPCHLPNNPGWPLRNFLALIYSRWNLNRVNFFCYRENRGSADMGLSLIGEALIEQQKSDWRDHQCVPNVVGWELNKGRKAPKLTKLAESMDPIRLAESAADLNLKLMKWRALPSLNIEKLKSLKCLLLGAGTLGCYVARSLMAWGVRNITLVDNGKVAMSNPLRQPLFTFQDSLNGGEFKAIAAAKSLQQICPDAQAKGVVMSIPMPGHPVDSQKSKEEESVLADCTQLQQLIDSHDVVFLLTDTRESRWLPTLFCANTNKIAITAALGFDSFLVMRHGPGPYSASHELKGEDENELSGEMGNLATSDKKRDLRLGCYFCNDVVAPTDSTANRTLDQQCTVTRPGLAPNASGLAVELLVGVLHHPQGIYAEGEVSSNSGANEQPLGILPHQIRGSLSQFSQMTLVGHSSTSCTACCDIVVSEYRKSGLQFILKAINHPTYLEDITGLTELKEAANSFDLDWEDEDEDGCVEI